MGERLTLKEIARHAKVSLATASLVVRSSPLVAAETRERVLSCINELGYVYDRTAAKLRTRLTHTIGLIVCEITNPFYAELTAGIDDVLDRAGWVAFLANTAESPSRQDRFIERMREHRVDGLLLSPAEGSTPELAERLTRLGIPVVQVLRRLGNRPANRVSANFRLGTTLAIEHLIRLGHKRIAFVGGGRRVSPARDRAAAYRETLARYGLPIGPVVNCRPTREDGARAVVELMRGTPTDPTAILCYNDICAFGVMVALTDLGVRVGPRLRGDRLRRYRRSRALSPNTYHREYRRPLDRGRSGATSTSADQGIRRPAGKRGSTTQAHRSRELWRPGRKD